MAAAARKRKAAKTPAANVENNEENNGVMPVLVPRPDGRGALNSGGTPGNRGGGRLPNAIRRKARRMLATRLDIVGHIADGVTVQFDDGEQLKWVSPRPAERLQALKLLADWGLGPPVSVADVQERMAQQLLVIRSRETWTAEELITALRAVWR